MNTHVFEPELNCPIPRPLRYRAGRGAGCGLWFMRLFILPHTIAGAMILIYAITATVFYIGVLVGGTDYEGTVVKKDLVRGGKGGSINYVSYSYTVDGMRYTDRVNTSAERFAQINEGDTFTVRAVPSAPTSGQWPLIPGHSPLLEVGGKWAFALFWNGLMSIFLWMIYIRPWRNWRLVRSGQPAPGIIRSMRVQVNKGTKSYRIEYEFAVPSLDGSKGRVMTGKMTSNLKEAANAHPGQLVTVLYDPDKPWRNIAYVFSDYRVAS